jgi:hypothetical protein
MAETGPIKARIALLIVLAAARPIAAPGQDSAAATRAGAPAAGVRIGDTYQQVIAAKGRPSSEITMGDRRLLNYADVEIKLRDDRVYMIEAALPRSAPTPSAAPALPGGPRPLALREDETEGEIRDFSTDVSVKFKEERFSELEEMASKLIREKSVFDDGSWKIESFHDALDLPPNAPDNVWPAVGAEIAKWETQFPLSITARVVHVRFLTAFAWHARGNPASDPSKDETGQVFQARLAQALPVLQAAQGLDEKSPMICSAGLDLALGQGWSVADVMREYETAERQEPEFWSNEVRVALFLLPRWYGKPGDWEAFAESELQRNDGLGAESYARVVYSMVRYYKNVFGDTRARWPVVKRGYATLLGKYSGSASILNQYALLAVLASDQPAARKAFDQMKGAADPSVWAGMDVSEYQKWAYSHP